MYVPIRQEQDLVEAVLGLSVAEDEQVLMLVAAEHQDALPSWIESLAAEGVSLFGAVFPGLIHGRDRHDSGAIVEVVPVKEKACVVDLGASPDQWTLGEAAAGSEEGRATVCVFVDCLSPSISDLLVQLFHHYGNAVNYIGAGAGNGELREEATVFTSAGPVRNAAVITVLKSDSRVSVRHGWERSEGPFVATRTEGNIIREINWEPARSVYDRLFGEEVGPITQDNFFVATKEHPFGIDKEGQEDVVRDPIKLADDGALVCLSDVPENSVMHVLTADQESLVKAAAAAVDDCTPLPGSATMCFVSDCYSRALTLGDEFQRELDAVADGIGRICRDCVPQGVLALGEIASNGEQIPEFYNKTFVVGVFHD